MTIGVHYQRAGELADFLRAHCEAGDRKGLRISALCRRFTTSEAVLARAFRNRYHCTIRAFIIRERMSIAQRLLLEEHLCISEIAMGLGYTSVSNFSRDFAKATGLSPLAWRKQIVTLAPGA